MEHFSILRATGNNLGDVVRRQTNGRIIETFAHQLHGLVHASFLTVLSPVDRAFGKSISPPPNPRKAMIPMHLHVCGADSRGLLAQMLKPAKAAGVLVNRFDFGLVGYDIAGARYRFALDLDISVPDSFVGNVALTLLRNAKPTDHIAVHDASGSLLGIVGESGVCAESQPDIGNRTCLVVAMSEDMGGLAYEFSNLFALCGMNIRAARGHHHFGRFVQSFVAHGSDHALERLKNRINGDDIQAKFSPLVVEQAHREYRAPQNTAWYEASGTHEDHFSVLQAIHAIFGRGLKLVCPFVELYVAPFSGSILCERVVFGMAKAISPTQITRLWNAYQPLRQTDFELFRTNEPRFTSHTVRAYDPFAGFTHIRLG